MMMLVRDPQYPSLYQVNTRVWLGELGRKLGRPATLDDAPDADLDELAALGFDWLWPLGVWQTGPTGRAISWANPDWRREYSELLPDWTDEDVCGSPFAVVAYDVHRDFGGNAALARFRDRLRKRGIRLLLDFVPNHTALDHPWIVEHPEYYINGPLNEADHDPKNWFCVPKRLVLAHGRDPYFPGWPDTAQLNYCHAGLRSAQTQQLIDVASRCDGVRCDMAMLLLPDVIARTWGDRAQPADGSPPVESPWWPEAIAAVKAHHSDFIFMGEVYWDREWDLQQQGFDYTYDKRLYDRLHDRDVAGVLGHLHADRDFMRRSVRFLENHDEPRAASAFPPDVHRAAAAIAHLSPGLHFFHDGEFDGRTKRTSMHLARRSPEEIDRGIAEFYGRLLSVVRSPAVRNGAWRLLEARPAWDGNPTDRKFVAFSWDGPAGERLLAAANYGPTQGQCFVPLPWKNLRGRQVALIDQLGPDRFDRDGDDLANRGLYLDVPAWRAHAFAVEFR